MTNLSHGLMFHRFHNQTVPPVGQGSLSPEAFEEVLHTVGVEKILSPEEWIFRLKRDRLRPEDLCVTFDDGLRCQWEVALPVLEAYGLKAFWFVYSSVFEGKGGKLEIYNAFAARAFGPIDEFYGLFFSKCEAHILKELEEGAFKAYVDQMLPVFSFYSMNDLKFRFIRNTLLPRENFEAILDRMMEEKGIRAAELSRDLWLADQELERLTQKGHSVGLHSYDHPTSLASLSYEAQREQYRKNYAHIQKVIRRSPLAMAHPLNSYNKETLKILKELGIVCGFRSNMTPPDGKKVNPSCLEIAREDPTKLLKGMSDKRVQEEGEEGRERLSAGVS